MQHLVDGSAWKDFDTKFFDFAAEPRNVRLGLVVDGFNPFINLSLSYSMWPVILTIYNLPSWLCMKEISFILTLLIPGLKSSGKDIDVYLRPLIDDLKDLWANPGVETIDVATGLKFNMRAMVLWTINDFPDRSSLFGWSGQGYKACPTCNEDTPYVLVDPPRESSRYAIMTQLARLLTCMKAKLEGSIAEGYVAKEAFTFSSYYFRDVTTKFNRPDRNGDFPPPTCQFQVFKSLCKSIGLRSVIRIDHQELKKVVWYVLHNSPEIDTYRPKFKSEFPNKYMKEEFPDWFGKQIRQRHVDNDPGVNESGELFALACGPSQTPILVNSCEVNGVRGVIVVEDDTDVIHVDSLSDLALSTSLNDLKIAALHIDGQSIDVDAPPDIIDVVDEDDDIIDVEDLIPHDLASSDDEDLVNLDIDDGVNVVYSSEEED
nr:hypothetical protein [Tanacetum cinerariifolium]